MVTNSRWTAQGWADQIGSSKPESAKRRLTHRLRGSIGHGISHVSRATRVGRHDGHAQPLALAVGFVGIQEGVARFQLPLRLL